jgi:hypothetical protein
MRHRGWVAAGVTAALLVGGAGAAYAYLAPGSVELSSPRGFFTFCADRQLDVAGITAADENGANNGGHAFRVENFIYPSGPDTSGEPVAGSDAFVLGKSGIQYDVGGSAPVRTILTTQRTEYGEYGSPAQQRPVQVRCKMRTAESLNKPESEKQNFDGAGGPSTVPWGFGPGTATGPVKVCRQVQSEIATTVWDALTDQQKDAAPFRLTDRGTGSANVDIAPEVETPFGSPITSETNVFPTGSSWTAGFAGQQSTRGSGFDSVRTKSGRLEIRSATLDSPTTVANPIGDRVSGAYYCTFSAPEYLRAVFLGEVTPPAAVSG